MNISAEEKSLDEIASELAQMNQKIKDMSATVEHLHSDAAEIEQDQVRLLNDYFHDFRLIFEGVAKLVIWILIVGFGALIASLWYLL